MPRSCETQEVTFRVDQVLRSRKSYLLMDGDQTLYRRMPQGFAPTEQFTKLQLVDTPAQMDLAQECTVAYSRTTSPRGAVT
jgi:hypothetical protein